MADFKHSIATVSLSGTLTEKIKAIAKAKYDGFELFENDLTASNYSAEEIYKIYSDLGLELVGLQPLRDFEAMPEPYKSRNFERAKHKFDLMHRLGTKKLFVCSNTSSHSIDNPEKAAEDLFQLAEMAEKLGFEIGYEALSWGKNVKTYHQSVDIVKKANHPALGNILDNFHINVLKSSYEDIYSIPKEKFTMVQVGDSYRYDMGAMHVGRHLRCFPGQGTYPVIEFVKAVRSTGYDGYLSHEIFNDEFRASSIEPVALDGKRSLIWLGENTFDLKKKKEEDFLETIDFISFNGDRNYTKNLISILKNIGFSEKQNHENIGYRSFNLGSANINIKTETTKFNSVEAIGFKTENIEAIQDLTKKLFYNFEIQNVLSIPSIKNCDELTYFLVQSNSIEEKISTDIEFKIDHLGLVIHPEFYQTNTLFYRTVLGLEIEETLEILDPRGIVSSSLAKNKNAEIQIAMSSTRSQNIKNQHNTSKVRINQIAFQTNDIIEFAKNIKNKDLVLPIPKNYYLDLRSKSFLSNEIIDEMQQLNILYDKHESGDFFHFYLKEINGLFIEIVERKANYKRFGEVNAQTRLAAQERDRK